MCNVLYIYLEIHCVNIYMLAICICLVAGDPDLFLGHVFFNMYTYIYI